MPGQAFNSSTPEPLSEAGVCEAGQGLPSKCQQGPLKGAYVSRALLWYLRRVAVHLACIEVACTRLMSRCPMPVVTAQGIREETRREQSAELKQGDVKWEVEVSLLQINLCSATAAGRFLLAAQKCQLSGSQLPASQRKALCIDMQARTPPELLHACGGG